MFEFIKKYIFFRVDSESKKAIRENVYLSDQKGYKIGLFVISLYEIFNVIRNLISYINNPSTLAMANFYLDLTLLITSLVFLLIIQFLKNMKVIPGFAVIHTMMCVVLLWGVAKSTFDSFDSPNIVAFSYVTLALVAFVCLEPWLIIIDLALGTIILNVSCYLVPSANISLHSVLDSIAVFVLGVMISVITFYRRNKSLILEIQVYHLNDELEKKAYFDDLTGLNNRRYLSENMNKALSVGEKSSGIILLDIDNFKKINDKYGHLSGDSALRTIGNIVCNNNDCDYSVRYGGEEILLFFQEITKEEIYNIAEGLRKEIESTIIPMQDGTQKKITASFGVALANIEMSYNQMIDLADEALYQAKKNGKNQTVINE